jgi:hypothetical protein
MQSNKQIFNPSLFVLLAALVVACTQSPNSRPQGSTGSNTILRGLAGATRYVATNGADTNPGTSSSPYRTIQKCATVSASGEACMIGAGTYRETVTPNSGVTFQPNGNVTVTVDGSDPVTGWTAYSGNIYKATVALNSSLFANQVFASELMMPEARFPNTGDDPLNPTWGIMKAGTTYTTVNDSALQNINWSGATIHTWSGTNPFSHQTGTVTGSSAGSVTFTAVNGSTCPFLCAKENGKYYIVGKLAALDSAKEWFYDSSAGVLYFWAPNGASPSNVQAKQRDYAFDLRGKTGVMIKNLKIFSSAIVTDSNSSGNTIDGIEAKYLSHYNTLPKPTGLAYSDGDFDIVASRANESGILVFGTNNTIKNSTLVYSAGNGIRLAGSSNTATNNLIHEMGYMGSYATGINVSGSGQTITQNTIYNTGRDAITVDWHVNGLNFQNNNISYNNAYNSSKIAPDSGVIYACCQLNSTGTRIHHNWVHDSTQTTTGIPTAGIYIDNGAGGFEIDQNVAWNNVDTGIYIHGDGGASKNNNIHNNDLLSGQTKSLWLLNISDATGTRIVDNKTAGTVVLSGSLTGLVNSNNTAGATGANEGYVASVGCNFSGCSTSGPPPRPASFKSAYSTVEAESYDGQNGTLGQPGAIGGLDSGDWLKYSGIDFGGGATKIIARIAEDNAYAGKTLEIRLDSTTGTLVGSLTVAGTGGWTIFNEQSTTISGATGLHDVYIVAQGGVGVANIDWFKFHRNALGVTEAKTYEGQNGTLPIGTAVGSLDTGDWLQYNNIDFGGGVSNFVANIAVDNTYVGRQIQIRLDSLTGTLVGTLITSGTGGWGNFTDQSAAVNGATGTHDVYLLIQGGIGAGNLNSFKFTSGGGGTTVTVDSATQGTGTNQLNYVGSGWLNCSGSCGATSYFNNTVSYTQSTNSYVQIAFTGTQITLYGANWGIATGIGAASIDGGSETNIDFSSVSSWTSPPLNAGNHTFKLRATGNKCASCTEAHIVVDKVEVTP